MDHSRIIFLKLNKLNFNKNNLFKCKFNIIFNKTIFFKHPIKKYNYLPFFQNFFKKNFIITKKNEQNILFCKPIVFNKNTVYLFNF